MYKKEASNEKMTKTVGDSPEIRQKQSLNNTGKATTGSQKQEFGINRESSSRYMLYEEKNETKIGTTSPDVNLNED